MGHTWIIDCCKRKRTLDPRDYQITFDLTSRPATDITYEEPGLEVTMDDGDWQEPANLRSHIALRTSPMSSKHDYPVQLDDSNEHQDFHDEYEDIDGMEYDRISEQRDETTTATNSDGDYEPSDTPPSSVRPKARRPIDRTTVPAEDEEDYLFLKESLVNWLLPKCPAARERFLAKLDERVSPLFCDPIWRRCICS